MDYKKLTREEAIRVITPMVDGEISEEDRVAFMHYVKGDPDVDNYYRREQQLKKLLQQRCPRVPAPPNLHDRIEHLLRSPGRLKRCGALQSASNDHAPFLDQRADNNPADLSMESPLQLARRNWYYLAAAAMVLIALAFYRYRLFDRAPHINVEEYTYRHFASHSGHLLPPTIATRDEHTAESELASLHHIRMHVPSLEGADFRGVVLSDFIKGYKTPMLEYQVHNSDQSIYIFAFNIDDLNRQRSLQRDADAVSECNAPSNYHIRSVNGKHVLSWKWNNTWYTAISNAKGHTLASMIGPLNR